MTSSNRPRAGCRFTPRNAPERPATTRFSIEHHQAPQGSRDYLLFAPPFKRGKRRLIIMLHGCHQEADGFARTTRMNTHTLKHNAMVAYPSQSTQANPGKCWN